MWLWKHVACQKRCHHSDRLHRTTTRLLYVCSERIECLARKDLKVSLRIEFLQVVQKNYCECSFSSTNLSKIQSTMFLMTLESIILSFCDKLTNEFSNEISCDFTIISVVVHISRRSSTIYLCLVVTFRRKSSKGPVSIPRAFDVITTSRSAAPLRTHLPNETETSARNKRYGASRALAITHVRSRYTFTCVFHELWQAAAIQEPRTSRRRVNVMSNSFYLHMRNTATVMQRCA